MGTLVNSLKRLYTAGSIKIDKINELLQSGKINQEEYDYIIGES
ncbi:MAG: XkdX family protein [Lachnospiraceae bacterium]|nr:XkdX family protein [Lachnospiraceae bacterium]